MRMSECASNVNLNKVRLDHSIRLITVVINKMYILYDHMCVCVCVGARACVRVCVCVIHDQCCLNNMCICRHIAMFPIPTMLQSTFSLL